MDILLRILGLFMLVIIIMFMIYLLYKAGTWFKRTSERLQLMEHWTEQHDKSYETKHIYSYIQKGQERQEGMIKELAKQYSHLDLARNIHGHNLESIDQTLRLHNESIKRLHKQIGSANERINKAIQKADHKLNPTTTDPRAVKTDHYERTAKDPVYAIYEEDMRKDLEYWKTEFTEEEFTYLVDFTVRHFDEARNLHSFLEYNLNSLRKHGPNKQ